MNKIFCEHGESHFCVDGNIVSIILQGAFNEYGFRSFFEKVRQIVDDLKGEKFYILLDVTEAIGGTPQLYLEAEKYNEWLNSQNMVAKAVVINSIVTLHIYKARVNAYKVQEHKFFTNRFDAINWLKSKQ